MNAESVPPANLRRLALFHRWQIFAAIAMILAVSCWILAKDVPGVFPDSVSPRLLEGMLYVLLTAVWVLSVKTTTGPSTCQDICCHLSLCAK